MSSLFPEFKVHTENALWKLTFKMFQIEISIHQDFPFFLFGLQPRHQADHLSGSVVLLSLLCVTPVFFFFQCCCFLSFWVSSRHEQSPQTAQPYRLKPRNGMLLCANYHAVNQSQLFLRIQAKFAFISGFRGWWLARCCAALSPLPLPLLSSHRADTAKWAQSDTGSIHDIFNQCSRKWDLHRN